MKDKHKSSAQMYPFIEEWEQTGLSVISFCKERDLSVSSFHYWIKKYRQGKSSINQSNFVRLQIHEKGLVNSGSCELVFPDGKRLVFHGQPEVGFLRSLLF